MRRFASNPRSLEEARENFKVAEAEFVKKIQTAMGNVLQLVGRLGGIDDIEAAVSAEEFFLEEYDPYFLQFTALSSLAQRIALQFEDAKRLRLRVDRASDAMEAFDDEFEEADRDLQGRM